MPDFLANAGGLIYLSEAHARAAQPDAPADFSKLSSERLRVIPGNLRQILEVAEAEGILPLEVAERRALESVAAARDGQDLG